MDPVKTVPFCSHEQHARTNGIKRREAILLIGCVTSEMAFYYKVPQTPTTIYIIYMLNQEFASPQRHISP